MKKESLMNIYEILDTDLVTNSLYKLISLCNESENFFLEFCKRNLVTKENLSIFIDISNCLSELDMYNKNTLMHHIIEVCTDDYIVCNCDYNYILETFVELFDFEIMEVFYVTSEEEMSYYKVFLIEEFIRFLNSQKNIDINKLYDNDMCFIVDNFKILLGDLINTESNELNPNMNDINVTRVKTFVDIISNKDIYEMGKEKYECTVAVAREVQNIDELKRIKNYIKINRGLDNDDFLEKIDEFSSNVNEVTINRLEDDLSKEEIIPLNLFEKIIAKYKMKKIKPRNKEEELNIIKKVLKPLDK